mmetsp:Transcript_50804/g.135555  ORF Transcript_50804/g.135555 Transcript_50804/m.135555 type:complete len:230 (+) Transcript_50804:253-942(+)
MRFIKKLITAKMHVSLTHKIFTSTALMVSQSCLRMTNSPAKVERNADTSTLSLKLFSKLTCSPFRGNSWSTYTQLKRAAESMFLFENIAGSHIHFRGASCGSCLSTERSMVKSLIRAFPASYGKHTTNMKVYKLISESIVREVLVQSSFARIPMSSKLTHSKPFDAEKMSSLLLSPGASHATEICMHSTALIAARRSDCDLPDQRIPRSGKTRPHAARRPNDASFAFDK